MKHAHENMFTGLHAPPQTMAYELLQAGYYWPGYFKDCQWYAKTCHPCQMHAVRHGKVGKMKLYGPERDGDWYAVDHKGPILPATRDGNRYITSIIDCFTGKVKRAAILPGHKQVTLV